MPNANTKLIDVWMYDTSVVSSLARAARPEFPISRGGLLAFGVWSSGVGQW